MFRRSKPVHHSVAFKESPGRIDYSLLVAVVVLSIFGLVMVYDASVVHAYKDFGDKYLYVRQQSLWMVLGFIALAFFSFFNHKNLEKLALPGFIISFLLLVAVFIPGLGVSAGGAHRWIKLGAFSLQPAEIIKLSSIIFFAALFAEERVFSLRNKEKIHHYATSIYQSKLFPFLISVFLVTFIIGILQRDLGSTIVYFLIGVTMYIASGAPLRWFWYSLPVTGLGFLVFAFSSTYRKNRILAFLDPFSDPQGYSYHISQILLALGSGGFLGLGVGQSRQKYEYIPEVTTDSIFAIVGEEFGFLGSLVLIALISFFIYKAFQITERAEPGFSKLLAFGITCWLGIQAIVNLAAMVSLIPLTGVPLPFISYGGSALLINLIAVGILLNISKQSK